jgi:hypothetical protein
MKKSPKPMIKVNASTNGHSKNGHVKQLKTDQQLALSKIQKRVLQYQVEATKFNEQARTMLEKARAADAEFIALVQGYARAYGIDANIVPFDFDKLQFKKKEVPA